METFVENFVVYFVVGMIFLFIMFLYIRRQIRRNKKTEEKIAKARRQGTFEPVSLHPVIDPGKCIQTGACIIACPEQDILGIQNGKATTINASNCVGHGACFHACPVQAITLVIGTETRGVELPHVNKYFESNVEGIYIAGELGGMGLIRNAVEQGRQAVENMMKTTHKAHEAMYDLVIVGAGPAGISASLTAKKKNLRCVMLEQETLGGAIFTYPRTKIVMGEPLELPLHGKLKLTEISKNGLLDIWKDVINKNGIDLRENAKAESIVTSGEHFRITTVAGEEFTSKFVLLATGRRGTPRKLGVIGEGLEKVAYRLLESENIKGKDIVIVGGGDSAVESALLLADMNRVTLSYRNPAFVRLKPENLQKISEALSGEKIKIKFNSNIAEITEREVVIVSTLNPAETERVRNDLVYIFAGGELPVQFLAKIGIHITKKFGEAVLKHSGRRDEKS